MANIAGYNRKVIALMQSHELVGEDELGELTRRSLAEKKALFDLLVEEDYLDEQTLIGLISEDCGLPPIDLDKMNIDMERLAELNKGAEPIEEDDAKRFGIMPVSVIGKFLTVAVSNPYDVVALDDIKLHIGLEIMPVVSSHRAINNAIETRYNAAQAALEGFIDDLNNDDDEVQFTEKSDEDAKDEGEGDLLDQTGDGAPAVKLVNRIILEALQKKASDIHIEPFEKRVRVRLRIDGVLHEVLNPPKRLEGGMVSRLKIMTDTMNIAEKGKPQDGRFQVKVGGAAIDFRVSSLPTVHGEKVCMRILDKSNLAGSLESLSFEPEVLGIIKRSISSPYGMLLVTGPTGSGKSTTLYSCLQAVMTVEDNVSTVEEPVEFEIEGLNQVHVNPKRGLTFASALRSLLRQDPDTIMIGEIRDQETVQIAVKAALTGHLVLSTLHTNDSTSTISRLVDMGVEPFLVSSTVLAVVAQRLGRRLCQNCKEKIEPEDMPSRERLLHFGVREEEIEGLELYKPKGCSLCSNGYKGRFALVEALEMQDELRTAIIAEESTMRLREIALQNGLISTRRAGVLNAMRGVTSMEEVERISVSDTDEAMAE